MPTPEHSSPRMASAAARGKAGFGSPLLPLLLGLFLLMLAANAFLIACNAGRQNHFAWLPSILLGLSAALFVLVAFGGILWLFTRSLNPKLAKLPPSEKDQPPRDPAA